MRHAFRLVLFMVIVSGFISSVSAQKASDAAQRADDLHLQLLDVQAKEAELQERARQLDENLKPENIERSLAGIGSTKPEELRELRRRQLSIERESVRTQLKLVVASRERLESSVRVLETVAYQKSADGTTLPSSQMLGSQATPRLLVGVLGGFVALLGIVLVVVLVRRPYLRW